MTALLASALLSLCASAEAREPPQLPPGVIVPPYEQPVERPLIQAALIVRGTILSIHEQPSPLAGLLTATRVWRDGEWVEAGTVELPYTQAYRDYTADRFTGYPDPLQAGRWGFQMLRVQVDDLIASEPGVNVKVGDTVDIYADGEAAVYGPKLIPFAERYVRREEGTVSPWSEADEAFIQSSADGFASLVYEATEKEACPGKAMDRGGYVLSVAATFEQLQAIAARVPNAHMGGGEQTPVDSRPLSVSHPFGGGTVGGLLSVNRSTFGQSPWTCDELPSLLELAGDVRGAR